MYDNNNSNGTEALKQFLLQIPKKKNNDIITEKSKDYGLHSPLFYLSIKNSCKDVIHIGANAEEYYHVELVCEEDNEIEYGIQAYGEEAKELYKEINTFSSTSDRLSQKEVDELEENDNINYKEEEQLLLVKKAIASIVEYNLTNGCVLVFRKFKNMCVSKRKIMHE
jgi:hypothetical protein